MVKKYTRKTKTRRNKRRKTRRRQRRFVGGSGLDVYDKPFDVRLEEYTEGRMKPIEEEEKIDVTLRNDNLIEWSYNGRRGRLINLFEKHMANTTYRIIENGPTNVYTIQLYIHSD